MSIKVTLDNFETLLDSHKLEVVTANSTWYAVRRNGQTKRWKRDPNRIRIPIKYGFKNTYAVTEHDFPTTLFRGVE